MENVREILKDKKRIVIKIGSSSLMHSSTGRTDLMKIERLVRILCDLKNSGKEIVLVSSGAIAVGRVCVGLDHKPDSLPQKQACAAIGQARLMMLYQKIFAEYNSLTAQVLLTKNTILSPESRNNARNTFNELLSMGAIPVVNENDSVSTSEIEQVQTFGDNDRLSAVVASIINADLLILLSDIDGMYTDDPKSNPDAQMIKIVEKIDDKLIGMGKATSGSNVGTGGMAAKVAAAMIATNSGTDMVITNGDDVANILKVINGEDTGTLFLNHKNEKFHLMDYL